jgi:hypothetical protein
MDDVKKMARQGKFRLIEDESAGEFFYGQG